MKPSPALCGRLKNRVRFTTKNVGKGFYRGNRTGALGAHTQFGNYLIDWRKVRHFVVPNLKDVKLTPFVSGNIYVDAELPQDLSGNPYEPRRMNARQYLEWWKDRNQNEYEYEQQEDERVAEEVAQRRIEEEEAATEVGAAIASTSTQQTR